MSSPSCSDTLNYNLESWITVYDSSIISLISSGGTISLNIETSDPTKATTNKIYLRGVSSLNNLIFNRLEITVNII
jgi:hypothetical protein